MAKKEKTQTLSYFAAANGYSGFRSYFKYAFDPQKFIRLFILKGGPGTGKSTIMKKTYESFKDKAHSSELIYCSSDVDSLDGIILRSEKGCVGIIDGTAPHATDPRYPGCIEEIINLGEYWNTEQLNSNRSKIEMLTNEKTCAYNKAYNFLNIAGNCTNLIDKELCDSYKDNESISLSSNAFNKHKLIDSFGKNGLQELDSILRFSKKSIGITGVWNTPDMYLKRITSMYSSDDQEIFPSVFSDSKIKAVYIKSEDTVYIGDPSSTSELDQLIDVSELLIPQKLNNDAHYLEKLSSTKEALLWNSQDEFKKASEYHFLLEDIYKSSMNFSGLQAINEKIQEKINNILF